jgi:hypothetical protein
LKDVLGGDVMHRKSKSIFLLILLWSSLSLATCVSPQDELHNQSILTVAAQATTRTQSFVETEAAKPTSTATMTPTLMFPTPVDYQSGSMYETPTPIATPVLSENEYALKDWTRNDALHLVQAMDDYAYKSDRAFGSSRGDFIAAQYPVRLAVLEALHQYPDFPYKQEIGWRLALSNAIQGNDYSNAWIAAQIETVLNEGRYGLEDLESMLLAHGFELVQSIETENLFSENQKAVVIQIMPINSWSDGQFMAIRNMTDRTIEVELIFTSWNYDYGNYSVTVDDHNRNGVPEVVIETHVQSGSMCSVDLLVYEWRQNQFEELTKGQIHSSECYYEWDFIGGEVDEAQLIEFEMVDIPGHYTSHELFKWDGMYYQLTESVIEPPHMFSIFHILSGNYVQARKLIEETLENMPEDYLEEIGPGFPDFLRFQLGLIAALQDDYEEAKMIFKSLAGEPYNSEYPAISNASQIFLSSYNQTGDIYQSCKSARAYLDAIIADVPGREGPYDDSPERKIWGYEPLIYQYHYICDLNSTFRKSVDDMIIVDEDDFADQLNSMGVTIHHTIPVDLSEDEVQDYIMLIETADSGHPCDRSRLWILRSSDQGYEAFKGDCIWRPDSPSTMESTVITIPGDERLGIIIQIDDSLYVICVTNEDRASSCVILDEINVASYEVVNTDSVLELQIYKHPSVYYTSAGGTYLWNEELGKFLYSDRIEDEIFDNNNPTAAIPLLNSILDHLLKEVGQDAINFDRYLYLLGLAHEFNGDSITASKVYWRLWHDFPESPYAVMASSKLELRSQ